MNDYFNADCDRSAANINTTFVLVTETLSPVSIVSQLYRESINSCAYISFHQITEDLISVLEELALQPPAGRSYVYSMNIVYSCRPVDHYSPVMLMFSSRHPAAFLQKAGACQINLIFEKTSFEDKQ